jgi:hypothetical protein
MCSSAALDKISLIPTKLGLPSSFSPFRIARASFYNLTAHSAKGSMSIVRGFSAMTCKPLVSFFKLHKDDR